jgi:hypothetical protein
MITTKELQFPVSLAVYPSPEDQLEISRLMAAAIVNPSFCQQLLFDPELAIELGYQDETFILSDAARYLVSSIHADTVAEMAQQIVQAFGTGIPVQSLTFTPVPEYIGT